MILSDFADILLGYKSFLNDFFYVDQDVIDGFGIEPAYLKPIYLRTDIRGDAYFQTQRSRHWLFWCEKRPADLRGTGAAAYILWAAKQQIRTRKQSGDTVLWKDSANLKREYWYWPPAPVHPTHIALRKGVGTRYAPLLFEAPVVVDQRFYVVAAKSGVSTPVLRAYLSSSLFPLSFETNGDLGLGAGVLTVGAENLRSLPTVDLKAIAAHADVAEVLEAADDLHSSTPPEAKEHATRPDLRRLDEALLACLGVDTARAVELEERVQRLYELRTGRATSRVKSGVEASRADINAATSDVVHGMEQWLAARRFPEDFIPDGQPQRHLALPGGPLVASTETMLDEVSLQVRDESGQVLLSESFEVLIAEVVVRALQLGRRDFHFPTERADAKAALAGFADLLAEYEDRLAELMSQSPLGPRYDSEVRGRVTRVLGVRPAELKRAFGDGDWSLGTG